MNIKNLIEAVKFQVSVKPQDDFMREVAEGLEKLHSDNIKLLSDYDAACDELKKWHKLQPIGCPVCHRGCFSNDKYCPHCGTSLRNDKNKHLKKFYFTYGTDSEYPFRGGWTLIYAADIKSAEKIFQGYHPNRPGSNCYNYSSCYHDDYFEQTKTYKSGNCGAFCHEVIRPQSIETNEEKEEYPFVVKVGHNSEFHSKSIEDYDDFLNGISTESITNFAEDLKSLYENNKTYHRKNPHTSLEKLFTNIDNLLKQHTTKAVRNQEETL